jgi:hypothetical protein
MIATAPTAAITISFGFTANPFQFFLSIKLSGVDQLVGCQGTCFQCRGFFALFYRVVKSLLRQIGRRRTAI